MGLFYTATKRRTPIALYAAALALVVLSACGRAPRKTSAHVPAPPQPANIGTTETGIASWYGNPYHGRQTASGEIYDMEQLTAAHRTLPFQTWLDVTNLTNGKHVEVRVTDRGPFIDGRVIDLSLAAARDIDMIRTGTARVRLKVIAPPKNAPPNNPPSKNLPPDNVASRRTDPAPQTEALPIAEPSPSTRTALASEPAELPTGNDPTLDPNIAPPAAPPFVQSPAQPQVQPRPKVQYGYSVQAGAFADLNRAEALRDSLAAQVEGLQATRVVAAPGRPTLWRVLAGRSLSLDDAAVLAAKVRKVAGVALVVPEPDPQQGDNP